MDKQTVTVNCSRCFNDDNEIIPASYKIMVKEKEIDRLCRHHFMGFIDRFVHGQTLHIEYTIKMVE